MRSTSGLRSFDEALTAGDAAAAAQLFLEDSYWRDLVAFTWNIKTRRGARRRARDMLGDDARGREAAQLARRPSRRTRPTASSTAWLEFETEVGRGNGLLRLQGRQGVDAADRARTSSRATRSRRARAGRKGVEHGAEQGPRDLARGAPARGRGARPRDAARGRDHRRRPGRHRARRAAAPARRPDDHRRAQRAPRRLLAQALQVAVPARPGLVRPPAVHQVPRELAGVLAQGQDRRLARDVHAGDGAQLLGLDDRQERARTTRTRASGPSSSSATAPTSRCGPKQLVLATGMSGKPNVPEIPGMDVFKGDQHHSSQHPGPDAYAGKRCVVIGSNNSAHDICAALWEAGADVTMVQRSSTHIVRSATLMDIGLGALYSEEAVAAGVTTEKADMIFASLPVPDPARVPDPALRRDARARQGLLRPARGGRLRPRLGRGRLRPVHEVPAARLGLLHRRRRLRAGRRRRREARQRAPSTT